jgi:hypothetical protein
VFYLEKYCHGLGCVTIFDLYLIYWPLVYTTQNYTYSCHLTTQLTGPQAGGHFTPTSWSFLHRLTLNWTLSLANQLLHISSLNWTRSKSKLL